MAYGLCDTPNDFWFLANWIDPGSTLLTGTSATAALSVENLRNPRLGRVWRTAAGGSTLTITFSVPQPIQVFAIFGLTNSNPTLTLRMGTAVGLGDIRTGPWNPGIDPYVKQAIWLNVADAGQTVAPMVKEIQLGVADSNFDIGRAWAGDFFWTPAVGHVMGSQQNVVDLSTIQRSRRSGAVWADIGAVLRTHQIDYDMISQDEWQTEVFYLAKYAAMNKQLFFVPNWNVYQRQKHAILGYQEQINPIATLGYDRWARSFLMKESG